ncbi:hypothetical protein EBN88_03520 [Streptomyces triticirhizae]|uniref:Uncharacterized protein n=1 Tax=Streptomyces triticirhizae TaxID=2483353 RepID=A0A3M2MDE2_9ACTN|nr:hypothetical protein EBN88_03520 [Streptomyces triticirhizae]
MWRVLLADGTRALTTQGHWAEALPHVEAHQGIGTRTIDDRQVAVLAALTGQDTGTAARLLAETVPATPGNGQWSESSRRCAGAPPVGRLTEHWPPRWTPALRARRNTA